MVTISEIHSGHGMLVRCIVLVGSEMHSGHDILVRRIVVVAYW